MLRTKTCEICGTVYEHSRQWNLAAWERSRFCSRPCFHKSRTRDRAVFTCKHCGKAFHPGHLYRLYCDQQCYFAYMRVVRYPLIPRKSKLFSRHIKRLALERAFGCCQSCGNAKDLEYDHIQPVHKGGEGTLENCQILCAACHLDKTITERGDLRRAVV